MVSSELQVMIESVGKTDFCPSLVRGYISNPQMHAEWNKNEWDFPTCKKVYPVLYDNEKRYKLLKHTEFKAKYFVYNKRLKNSRKAKHLLDKLQFNNIIRLGLHQEFLCLKNYSLIFNNVMI